MSGDVVFDPLVVALLSVAMPDGVDLRIVAVVDLSDNAATALGTIGLSVPCPNAEFVARVQAGLRFNGRPGELGNRSIVRRLNTMWFTREQVGQVIGSHPDQMIFLGHLLVRVQPATVVTVIIAVAQMSPLCGQSLGNKRKNE